MNELLDYLPTVAQIIFTCATVPRAYALCRAKTSREHSIFNGFGIMTGHLMLSIWGITRVQSTGFYLANVMAIMTTAVPLSLVLYYRRYPGGRGVRHCDA